MAPVTRSNSRRLQIVESLPRPGGYRPSPTSVTAPRPRRVQADCESASDVSDFEDTLPLHFRLSAELNRNAPRPTRASSHAQPDCSLAMPFPVTGCLLPDDVRELQSELRVVRVRGRDGVLKPRDKCAICHEFFGRELLSKWPCPHGQQHAFHFLCCRKFLQFDRRCPICRHCPFAADLVARQ